ncbi:sel1 repeat family protein [Nitrosomonas sp. HPC101]|nr:sel1 repeat family protein [Nitrosomonas sp. HPC101]
MTINCTQCGSSRTYRSHFRPGERTPLNLLLSPYRCRDCKARFWRKNSDAYFVATISVGGVLLLGTLIWIGFSTNEPIRNNLQDQSQTVSTKSSQGNHNHQSPSATASKSSTRSETVTRGEKINPESIRSEESYFMPGADDNRLYTMNLFLEKARKGNADAQYQLGLLYLTGKGTLQDFSEASKWFILAAEQNHPLAQYELGLLYQIGQGVEIDNEKSYVWFNLAAAAGVEQAALARDKALRSLSRAQLASAQKTAREWLASRSRSGKQLSGQLEEE